MLEGIKIKELQRRPDERGSFTEIIREDWEDILSEKFLQANLSITFPGIIRAWHRHNRGQIDYFVVLNGVIKICVYDDETRELSEIISTGLNPQIVRVPGKYWHGFKALGEEHALMLNVPTELYNYKKPDEYRLPPDTRKIPYDWKLSPWLKHG